MVEQEQVTTQAVRRAVDTVLEELGGRYIPLVEVCDRVADLLAAEPDPDDVSEAVRDAVNASDPCRDEAEQYDAMVEDRICGLAPDWAARMDHYRGDTRYEVAF